MPGPAEAYAVRPGIGGRGHGGPGTDPQSSPCSLSTRRGPLFNDPSNWPTPARSASAAASRRGHELTLDAGAGRRARLGPSSGRSCGTLRGEMWPYDAVEADALAGLWKCNLGLEGLGPMGQGMKSGRCRQAADDSKEEYDVRIRQPLPPLRFSPGQSPGPPIDGSKSRLTGPTLFAMPTGPLDRSEVTFLRRTAPSCPSCGSDRSALFVRSRSWGADLDDEIIRRCTSCGQGWSVGGDPIPA